MVSCGVGQIDTNSLVQMYYQVIRVGQSAKSYWFGWAERLNCFTKYVGWSFWSAE